MDQNSSLDVRREGRRGRAVLPGAAYLDGPEPHPRHRLQRIWRVMHPKNRVVQLAGSTLDCSCHACAFFHSNEDEYRTLLPFLKEGIEAGDKTFQIVDKAQHEERRRVLTDNG